MPQTIIKIDNANYTNILKDVHDNLDKYIGKTIKMNGTCSLYQDPDTQKLYYACIIQDATQCCSQGLVFELEDSKYTSDDYPNPDDEITVQGTFSTYMEDGNEYLVIKDAILIE